MFSSSYASLCVLGSVLGPDSERVVFCSLASTHCNFKTVFPINTLFFSMSVVVI